MTRRPGFADGLGVRAVPGAPHMDFAFTTRHLPGPAHISDRGNEDPLKVPTSSAPSIPFATCTASRPRTDPHDAGFAGIGRMELRAPCRWPMFRLDGTRAATGPSSARGCRGRLLSPAASSARARRSSMAGELHEVAGGGAGACERRGTGRRRAVLCSRAAGAERALLTETARDFFEHLGLPPSPRGMRPPSPACDRLTTSPIYARSMRRSMTDEALPAFGHRSRFRPAGSTSDRGRSTPGQQRHSRPRFMVSAAISTPRHFLMALCRYVPERRAQAAGEPDAGDGLGMEPEPGESAATLDRQHQSKGRNALAEPNSGPAPSNLPPVAKGPVPNIRFARTAPAIAPATCTST